MIRVNDKVRIIDPKHEEFDQVAYVTAIQPPFYYLEVIGDNTQTRAREAQLVSE